MTISVPVPPGTRGKQLDVVLRKDAIKVGLKGEPPVIEGSFPKEIKVDDSTWTLGASYPSPTRLEQMTISRRLWADPRRRPHPLLRSHARRRLARGDRLARKGGPAVVVGARRHERTQDRHDQDHARELEAERPRRRDARHGREDDGAFLLSSSVGPCPRAVVLRETSKTHSDELTCTCPSQYDNQQKVRHRASLSASVTARLMNKSLFSRALHS